MRFFFNVQSKLGSGLLEKVFREIFAFKLIDHFMNPNYD